MSKEKTNILNQITPENVRSKLEWLSKEEKELLLDTLLKEKEATEKKETESVCPYPENTWCAEVWKTLNSEQKKEMEKNIRISPKWWIDIVPMNIKNMQPLTATPDNITIFDGSYVDKNGNAWAKWVTYLTKRAARNECEKQWKQLLKDREEVMQFIEFFPWKERKDWKEKYNNLIKIFDLKKTGCLNLGTGYESLYEVYAILSGMDEDGYICGVKCHNVASGLIHVFKSFASPYLAFDSE